MKLNRNFLGIGLAAVMMTATAVVTTTMLRADDKTNAPAKKTDDFLIPDPVIARGKGVEIKRSRLDEAISGLKASASARGQQIAAADMPLIAIKSFDHLLQVQLLNAKASDADKAAGKVEGDKRMETIRKRAPSADMLERQLKALSLTVEDLHKRLIEEATAEAVLRDKVTVTDADVKKYYDTNTVRFEEPEMVKVAHILISTGDPRSQLPDADKKAKLKIAEGILKRAKAGEDFAKLAKEYSDDPGSKDQGGEYPAFPHGTMVKEFEAAAFSLQTNQISDIVTTVYGYHIIKLLEKIPAKKHEFSEPEVKDIARKQVELEQMEAILPVYYVTLKKEANVEILDDQLKALEDAPMDFSSKTPDTASPATKTTPK